MALKYSPVNWLIVDWKQFNAASLPRPQGGCADEPEQETTSHCEPQPLLEAVSTHDWAIWLPEVVVGIPDSVAEIAANYTRQAAIEFARKACVLQRTVRIELQPDTDTYPVTPMPGERTIGVLAVHRKGHACSCAGSSSGKVHDIGFSFTAQNEEVHIAAERHAHGHVDVVVWASPTEDACFADEFLYEHFHREITQMARYYYALALHFRDRALVSSLVGPEVFARSMLIAKRNAVEWLAGEPKYKAGSVWAAQPRRHGARYYGHH